MRLVVTGGTGYVGRRLSVAARAAGHELAVISRSPGSDGEDTTRIVYDGTPNSLARGLTEWRPDAAVHLAADVRKGHSSDDIDALLESNVIFPMHFASACLEAGVRKLINISTFSTFSRPDTYTPQTFYAATKRATEDLLAFFHQAGLIKVCSLCFYDVYGPGQAHQRFLPALMRSIASGEPMTMSMGEQEICFIHVDDAVSSILFALDEPAAWSDPNANIYTVHGDQVLKLRDVPEIVAKVQKLPCPEIRHTLPYRPREIMVVQPPFPRLPGWRPAVAFRDGIAGMLA